jgi:hypothetical protein
VLRNHALAFCLGPVSMCILERSAFKGRSMGIKWTATLHVEFELVDGQEERLARVVLTREVGRFRLGIEQGIGLAPTGVKRGSAKVEIASQGLETQT